MTSLLRPNPQMADPDTERGFRVLPALVWAMFAGLFTFGGLWMRYPAGSNGPIPGIHLFPIQAAVSGLVAGGMFLTTWFIRSRTVRHIRWAVITSLLVHLLLCLALRFLVVGLHLADTGSSDEPAPLRELTLPDYGGMQIFEAETQEWERPTEIELPEQEQPPLERQQTAPDFEMAPDDLQPDPANTVHVPQRRDQPNKPTIDDNTEFQREVQDVVADAPQKVDSPDVADVVPAAAFTPDAAETDTPRTTETLPETNQESLARAERSLPDMSDTAIDRRVETQHPEFSETAFEPQRNSRRPALPETQIESVQVETSRSTNSIADAQASSLPRRNRQLPARTSRQRTESRSTNFRPTLSEYSNSARAEIRPQVRDDAGSMSALSSPQPRQSTLAPAESTAINEPVSSPTASSSPSQLMTQPGPRAASLARTTSGRFAGGAAARQSPGAGAPSRSRSTGSSSSRGQSAAVAGLSRGRLSGNRPSISSPTTSGGSIANSGRRAAAASLSADSLRAEQAGGLVLQGPQAGGGNSAGQETGRDNGFRAANGGGQGSSGRLSGPRVGSLSRRSTGLPGARSGGGTASGGSPSGRRALPGSGRPGNNRSAGRMAGLTQPKLGSRGRLSGMIGRRPAPAPEAAGAGETIRPGFAQRGANARSKALKTLGGSEASEKAVERGLAWLAAHQYAAGNWSTHALNCEDHECGLHGMYRADSAATGLALLAFLGAGHTHRSGDYQREVQRGLDWLVNHQKSDGDLFSGGSDFVWFYSHGMATIALCEAYGMTKDAALRQPAQRALDFIVQSQHPDYGGWRYRPQFESDTSVSGWQLMALKSGEMAGLTIPQSVYRGIRQWLDSARKSPGRYAYHGSQTASSAMSAEALLMRQYLGVKQDDPDLEAGAGFLQRDLPRNAKRDVYYWYYATQFMFHMQGPHWDQWNAELRDLLISAQEKNGATGGSWSPVQPTRDKWGEAGGRHYMTCLNLLMLEVYYRHLPLYQRSTLD